MCELLEISGRKFYYYNVDNLLNMCNKLSSCAIVVDEQNIDLLLEKYSDFIGNPIHQIIFISETLNKLFDKIKTKDVFLIALPNFQLALQLTTLPSSITNNIICVVNTPQKEVKKILKLMNQ